MPLSLDNSPQTARPITFTIDPESIEQSKEMIDNVRSKLNEGYEIELFDEMMVEMTPPERDSHQMVFRILTENGDDRLVWDRRDLSQIKEARDKFDEYLTQGYSAYLIRFDGKKGSKLEHFNDILEMIEFSKEAILVPSSSPG